MALRPLSVAPESTSAGAFTCPHCQQGFELTSAMTSQLEARIRSALEAQAQEAERQLAKRQTELAQREAAMQAARQNLEIDVAKRLTAERKATEERLRAQLRVEAHAELAVEITESKSQMTRLQEKLTQTQQAELELRKRSAALEEQKRELELTKQRELDAMRHELVAKTRLEAAEDFRLTVAEKEKAMDGMRKQIEDLRQKAIQGSQQTQGDVQEVDLEASLRAAFPHDVFEAVPTGVCGADVVQRVHAVHGALVGTILWESKRTKHWKDEWLTKLKKDQRDINADLTVLVSHALPKDVTSFGEMNGVWVSNTGSAVALAGVLRYGLFETSQARLAAAGQQGKTEQVYGYLTGPLFRQRVETILEAWQSMQEDLETEKRVITKQWAKRAKQLEVAMGGTSGMYGDLQGIAGRSVLELQGLDLHALEAATP